jgi:hypothetical protein
MTHTLEDIRARANQLVAEKGEDYVYAHLPYTDGCVYFKMFPVWQGVVHDEYDLASLSEQDIEVIDAWEQTGEMKWACDGWSCFVGAIIAPWLSAEQKLHIFDHENSTNVSELCEYLFDEEVLVRDKKTVDWLEALQVCQDGGSPWGEAILKADAAIMVEL